MGVLTVKDSTYQQILLRVESDFSLYQSEFPRPERGSRGDPPIRSPCSARLSLLPLVLLAIPHLMRGLIPMGLGGNIERQGSRLDGYWVTQTTFPKVMRSLRFPHYQQEAVCVSFSSLSLLWYLPCCWRLFTKFVFLEHFRPTPACVRSPEIAPWQRSWSYFAVNIILQAIHGWPETTAFICLGIVGSRKFICQEERCHLHSMSWRVALPARWLLSGRIQVSMLRILKEIGSRSMKVTPCPAL